MSSDVKDSFEPWGTCVSIEELVDNGSADEPPLTAAVVDDVAVVGVLLVADAAVGFAAIEVEAVAVAVDSFPT